MITHTRQQHIDKLLPQARKHVKAYGVSYMIFTIDDGEQRGWHIRPLSYADDPEFEAFEGKIELIVHPEGDLE